MPLNIFQNPDQSSMLMQKQWASQLNPILGNPLLQGSAISQINLTANVPLTINHYLGRQMQGWFITDITTNAIVWRTKPMNSQTLTLEANSNTTISLWVF
jgi:hypothetical protein